LKPAINDVFHRIERGREFRQLFFSHIRILFTGLFYFIILPISPALAATYYVDQANGSASNPGTEAKPFKDISQAAAVLRAGDTALVKNGTYDGGKAAGGYEPANSGTAGAPITFKAYPGHHPVIKGTIGSVHLRNYITWDGFLLKGTFAVYGDTGRAVGWTFINNEVTEGSYSDDGNWTGFFIEDVDGALIRNNNIHNIRGYYVTQVRGTGIIYFRCHSCVVENNYIHDNADQGAFDKEGGLNNVWRRNIFRDNTHTLIEVNNQGPNSGEEVYENIFVCTTLTGEFSVDLHLKTQNARVYNNVFSNCNGVSAYGGDATEINQGFRIYNNIFYNSGIGPIAATTFDRWNANEPEVLDYNLYYNVLFHENRYSNAQMGDGPDTTFSLFSAWTAAHSNFDRQSISDDPRFVNPSTMDFHLQANSPARGAGQGGVDMGAYPRNDSTVIGLLSGQSTSRPLPPSGLQATVIE
jgi:hypothetical protein